MSLDLFDDLLVMPPANVEIHEKWVDDKNNTSADSDNSPSLLCSTCSYPHYWLDGDAWHCNRCRPRPNSFLGTTLTVSGGDRAVDDIESTSADSQLELVSCATCCHFQPDTIGDGSGIGDCAIDAPATRWQPPSKQNPGGFLDEVSLYPNAERYCSQFDPK